MKTNLEIKLLTGLFAAVLVVAGCKKEEKVAPPAPPTPPPAPAVVAPPVTNAPPKEVAPAGILSPTDAKNHVGEEATVRGKVYGVFVSQKGDVFMSMGAAHPKQPFTAVCFQGAIQADDLKKFNGKTVSVKGKIKEYNGQVEIVLDTLDQISE